MTSKKWLILWFIITIIIIPFVIAFNYLIDPYGFRDSNNKFDENIVAMNNPDITNIKLNLEAGLYLIGTSRVKRIHPNIIENFTNKHTFNINIAGATFSETSMLAQEIKNRNKNVIFGFDAFSLNKNRIQKEKELQIRYKSFKKAIENNNNSNMIYISLDFFIDSIKHVLQVNMNKKFDQYRINENNQISKVTFDGINEHLGLDNKVLRKNFSNYEVYTDQDIINFGSKLTDDDIIIIYPKHYYHYVLFQKYQNIESKYFHALKILVLNTKAKVWSFYQINEITKNSDNFDNYGWHFKPKIANLIFSRIYKNDRSIENFGIELNSTNIDLYISNTIKDFKPQ